MYVIEREEKGSPPSLPPSLSLSLGCAGEEKRGREEKEGVVQREAEGDGEGERGMGRG
jgi:hypothetical protein